MRVKEIGQMRVVLEHGPLAGAPMEVPMQAVSIIQTLDDGLTVVYRRWEDLVFRWDPTASDGAAKGLVS